MNATSARELMVDRSIRGRGVRDARVLAAMETVPREAFLPPELGEFAYDDRPLPIEAGQTISQPYIVALMTEALQLGSDDDVLEIGTGSGYAAAVLAAIAFARFRAMPDVRFDLAAANSLSWQPSAARMDRADACARSGESCRVPDRPGSSPGPPSVPLQDRSRGIEFALATRNRTTCSCAFLLSSCSPSGVYRTPSRRCQRLVRS